MSDTEDDEEGLCEHIPPSKLELRPELVWKQDTPPFRELSISGDICEDLARQFEVDIRKLQQVGAEEIVLSIDSGGGCIFSCMRMMSLLESLEANITTVCRGRAESAASILFACGDRRIMDPRSKIMIHNIHTSTKSKETLPESRLDLEETERINQSFCDVYARASNKTRHYFIKIMERNLDVILTPEDALEIGLATDIGYVDVELVAQLKTHVRVKSSKKISRKRKR